MAFFITNLLKTLTPTFSAEVTSFDMQSFDMLCNLAYVKNFNTVNSFMVKLSF